MEIVIKKTKIMMALAVALSLMLGVIGKSYADNVSNVDAFKDVKATDYYYNPVKWAVENGVSSGTSNNTFSPTSPCTRAQVMTFLWRAMGSPEPHRPTSDFIDVKETDYYKDAVQWAVENNVTAGTSNELFSPNAVCTRGQVMTFLWRAEKSPQPKTRSNVFKDVSSSNYYYNPVLWAVENGVTAGTGRTTFSPGQKCTRGQVMTFLWHVRGDVAQAKNWKEGYKLYLDNIPGARYCTYSLVYSDADNIPELIIHDSEKNNKETVFDFDYFRVATYDTNNKSLSHVTGYNTYVDDIEYIEKGNHFLIHHKDNFVLDTSLRYLNGKWVSEEYGYHTYEDNPNSTFVKYVWKDREVSKEEYYMQREKVYDSNKSKEIHADLSYQELLAELK